MPRCDFATMFLSKIDSKISFNVFLNHFVFKISLSSKIFSTPGWTSLHQKLIKEYCIMFDLFGFT